MLVRGRRETSQKRRRWADFVLAFAPLRIPPPRARAWRPHRGHFVSSWAGHATEGGCDTHAKPRSHDTARIAWASCWPGWGRSFRRSARVRTRHPTQSRRPRESGPTPHNRHRSGVTKAIHDPTTEAGKHASVDHNPLISQAMLAEVPLAGLPFFDGQGDALTGGCCN
jgi:hypothetical protein